VAVNEAAHALLTSYTDQASRQAARVSRETLPQREEDYRLGPEDLLEVTIYEWEKRDESKTDLFRVSQKGSIALPVVGGLHVAGTTASDVKAQIEERLKKGDFLKSPMVAVEVAEFRSKKISVLGAVRKAGVFQLRQNVATLVDVLSMAGGLAEHAGYTVQVVRPKRDAAGGDPSARQVVTIDLHELIIRKNLDLNIVLQPGDAIVVPDAGRASVVGYVRKPTTFALRKPTTVLEAIAMSEGLIERQASARSCVLKRRTVWGEVIIPIDLVAISQGEEPNSFLMPDDVIDVRQTTSKGALLEIVDFIKGVLGLGLGV
jgi:polysaccharide export outer membrane protein